MKDLIEIVESIESDFPNINPTEIFNEGWMLRLLVKKSIELNITIKGINFAEINNWTSEALISSPFIQAPEKREGYTHVDMALGDFTVNYAKRGKILINKNAKLFGIIEAKMKSNLSQGTKYANDYNQASRNIACIAKNTINKDCRIFFAVSGPKKYLDKHKIDRQIKHDLLEKQIVNRFAYYENSFQVAQKKDKIVKKIKECDVFTISYENWIDEFDGNEKVFLLEFYEKAKYWNKL
jgi:hypothetical protein